MSECSFPGTAPSRERSGPPSLVGLTPTQIAAIAEMCRAIGDEGRLRLFKHIVAAGRGGCQAAEINDPEGLRILIEGGAVARILNPGGVRYRADVELVRQALLDLVSG